MKFSAPFYEFQEELYALLTKADEMDFQVFDSAMTVNEISEQLKNLSEVKFGVIADVSAAPTSSKVDAIIWAMSVRIELFSNYRGRKKIAEMINKIGSVATEYLEAFDSNMMPKGFSVVRMSIGESTIGSATGNGSLIWQNGYINLTYYLSQLEE